MRLRLGYEPDDGASQPQVQKIQIGHGRDCENPDSIRGGSEMAYDERGQEEWNDHAYGHGNPVHHYVECKSFGAGHWYLHAQTTRYYSVIASISIHRKLRYLLSDYHFGAKIVPFPPHPDEISSEDVEPLAEPGILHPAHDSNPQEEFVTTGTLDNATMMPSEQVAT